MTVTQKLQAPGSITVKLRDDIPPSVTRAIRLVDRGFAQILVLPGRAPEEASVAQLKALAIYAGVYRGMKGRTELYGAGPEIWLGDEDDKGDTLVEANNITKAAGTFVQWVTDLLPSSISAGTIHAQAGTLNWTAVDISRRAALDYVCDSWDGREWRIDHSTLELSAGTVAQLYGTTPSTIITPDWDGTDGELRGLRATATLDQDLEDYTSDVTVRDAAGNEVTVSTSSAPFVDPNGDPVIWHRFIDATEVTSGTASSVATGQLTRFAKLARRIAVASDVHALPLVLRVGEYVWVYDPVEDLVDTANEVSYRGQLCWPIKARLVGYTWPIGRRMAVHLIQGSDAVDLTDWFVPDTGRATLEVDTPARTLRRTMQARSLRQRG